MDHIDSDRIMILLIEYFEAGNKESDSVAKKILQSSPDYATFWQSEVDRIQQGTQWTGLRAVEAEIISSVLRRKIEE